MHMMRRLKSIASGRSSVSDSGGDSDSKRPKFEQDGAGDIVIEPHLNEDKPMRIDQELSSSPNRDAEASTSTSMEPVKTEEPGTDLLPKEMNDMTISDDKADGHNDKETLDGNGTEKGQIIATTIGGHNGEAKAEGLIHGRMGCWYWFIWCSFPGKMLEKWGDGGNIKGVTR